MKKGLLFISLGIFILAIVLVITLTSIHNKKLSDAAVKEAVEEFEFDYENEIYVTKVETLGKYKDGHLYVVTIYGEEHFEIYLVGVDYDSQLKEYRAYAYDYIGHLGD